MDLQYNLPTLHRPISRDSTADYVIENDMESYPNPVPPHTRRESLRSPTRRAALCRAPSDTGSIASVPNSLTDKDWRVIRAGGYQGLTPTAPDFLRSYEELMSKMAYRHPNPGSPSMKSGKNGGTWRHTKECIGYGPGRLLWIDGVVSSYDETINQLKPWEHGPVVPIASSCSETLTSGFGNRFQQDAYESTIPLDQRRVWQRAMSPLPWYSANIPQPLLFAGRTPNRGAAAGKVKGFYSLTQRYE